MNNNYSTHRRKHNDVRIHLMLDKTYDISSSSESDFGEDYDPRLDDEFNAILKEARVKKMMNAGHLSEEESQEQNRTPDKPYDSADTSESELNLPDLEAGSARTSSGNIDTSDDQCENNRTTSESGTGSSVEETPYIPLSESPTTGDEEIIEIDTRSSSILYSTEEQEMESNEPVPSCSGVVRPEKRYDPAETSENVQRNLPDLEASVASTSSRNMTYQCKDNRTITERGTESAVKENPDISLSESPPTGDEEICEIDTRSSSMLGSTEEQEMESNEPVPSCSGVVRPQKRYYSAETSKNVQWNLPDLEKSVASTSSRNMTESAVKENPDISLSESPPTGDEESSEIDTMSSSMLVSTSDDTTMPSELELDESIWYDFDMSAVEWLEDPHAHWTENTNCNYTENTNANSTENTDTNPSKNTDANPTENTNVNPTENTDANYTENTDANPTENTDANPTENIDANPTENTDANLTENTDANPTENTDVNPTENTDANPTENTDANPTENTDANYTENTDANPTENTDANLTENTDANSTENTDANSTENTDANPTENTDANST